ncbi:hypothetical protein RFI_20358 [Reticulomyxa filosa]|uniref:Uncharacterized protein n=1 Tax=Reticulomyxa filosa TaxID=46433 RepID=X6MT30_RETFI|nr:hypothetical protein RFI_20358 [Reticulomyxa filosa]|eukprot:ETO16979.1 hypothetical protein RFI_20358 [Reticulomyxa filosa]
MKHGLTKEDNPLLIASTGTMTNPNENEKDSSDNDSSDNSRKRKDTKKKQKGKRETKKKKKKKKKKRKNKSKSKSKNKTNIAKSKSESKSKSKNKTQSKTKKNAPLSYRENKEVKDLLSKVRVMSCINFLRNCLDELECYVESHNRYGAFYVWDVLERDLKHATQLQSR